MMSRADKRRIAHHARKGRKMKYIKNELFNRWDDTPFTIGDSDKPEPGHHGTFAEVLRWSLKFYDVNHSVFVRDGNELTLSEASILVKLLKLLPQQAKDPEIVLESADYEVMAKVLGWIAPKVPWFLDMPAILELVRTASDISSRFITKDETMPKEVIERASAN